MWLERQKEEGEGAAWSACTAVEISRVLSPLSRGVVPRLSVVTHHHGRDVPWFGFPLLLRARVPTAAHPLPASLTFSCCASGTLSSGA